MQDITTYHSQKNIFYIFYSKTIKVKVCYFIKKKMDQSIWAYIMDRPNFMGLHFSLPDKYIHIYNFHNLVNLEEVNTSISILNCRLVAHLNKENIILGDFNFHHDV